MSLVAWFPLNGDAHNQGSHTLHMADLGNNAWDVGKTARYCYSNNSYSTGGYVSAETIQLGQNQSIFAWIKFDSLMSDSSLGGSIAGQHRYPSNTGMGLTIKYVSSTSGYLSVNTGNGSDRTYNTYCGDTLLLAGIWYSVGYTYDGSTIRLYVNGNLDGTHSYSGMQTPADYFMVGCWSFANSSGNSVYGNYKMRGQINDVRAYNHTLCLNEIKEINRALCFKYTAEFDSLFTPVEYIENPSEVYIDTNISSCNNLKIIMKYKLVGTTGDQTLFGTSTEARTSLNAMVASNTWQLGANGWTNVANSTCDNNIRILECYFSSGNSYLNVDGTRIATSSNSWSLSSEQLYLFKHYNRYPAYMRVYYCKIYVDGILVRNFVPCYHKFNYIAGLYDTINCKFHKPNGDIVNLKAAVDDFTYPQRLLDTNGNVCIRVPYIEFKGKSQVDLGTTFYLAGNCSVTFQSTTLNQNGMIFANSNTTNHFWWYHYNDGSNIALYLQYQGSQVRIGGVSLDLNKHVMEWRNNELFLDGNCIGTDTRSITGHPTESNLYLGSWGGDYPYYGKIYDCTINYNHKYVPVINLNNTDTGAYSSTKIGFLDLITKTFHEVEAYTAGVTTDAMPGWEPLYLPDEAGHQNAIYNRSTTGSDLFLYNPWEGTGTPSTSYRGDNSISPNDYFLTPFSYCGPFTVVIIGQVSAWNSSLAWNLGGYASGSISYGYESKYVSMSTGATSIRVNLDTTDQLHHYAFVYNGLRIQLWIDGVFKTQSGNLSGSLSNTTNLFYIRGYPIRCYSVYSEALSENDIILDYKNTLKIDKNNFITYNIKEQETNTHHIGNKQQQLVTNNITEYMTLDDGSVWVPISVHYVPDGVFTNASQTYLYQTENRWTNFGAISTMTRPESGYYEFYVTHQTSVNGNWTWYRFKQNVNPMSATWDQVNPSKVGTNVTRISCSPGTTNNYAGMYWFGNSNCPMCFANGSNGNWFGCGIRAYWGTGYIPSYNGQQCWGWQIVYMRISPSQSKVAQWRNTWLETKEIKENIT